MISSASSELEKRVLDFAVNDVAAGQVLRPSRETLLGDGHQLLVNAARTSRR